MQEAKIIDYLGENKFVVIIPPKVYDKNPDFDEVIVAHDYVMFGGSCNFQMDRKPDGTYPYENTVGASNWISSHAYLQIGIREMIDVILPFLNNHEYLQKEHLKDREYDSDDKYYEMYGLTEPRYKKGDQYPAYASAGTVMYTDPETKERMVKFRRSGSASYETVTLKTYQLIKDTLMLCLSEENRKLELQNENTVRSSVD